jgi:uncharacterized protein
MTAERKALLIFTGVIAAEGSWFGLFWGSSLSHVQKWFGVGQPGTIHFLSWLAAALVAIAYSFYSRRLPSVRRMMFRPDLLKLVAICAAIVAALCEEGVFRKMLMDALKHEGFAGVLQVLASGLAFGAAHALWGLLKGSLRAASAAMIATGVLGTALAVVYLLAGRNVWPCVVSHFVVTATIEPGLVLSALRGEMGRT